jgi:hypothetical protein
MKSARGNFAFAARLICFLSLLLFVVLHARAQEEEKTPAEQSSAPKASGNQRPAAKQEARAPRGNNDAKAGAGASRGSSTNAPARSGSPTGAKNGNDDGSSKPARGWRSPAANAPGRSASSTETAQDAPEASEDKPASRGPRNNGPRQSGSSTDPAKADPRPSRNAQAGRGSSTNTPAQPTSPTNTGDETAPSTGKPVRSGPWNGRPGQGGSSTNKPVRPGAPADAEDNSKPPKNGPAGRGSSNKPADWPGKVTNKGEKNASGNVRPNSTKGGFSRTTRANGTVVERDNKGRTTSVTTPRGTTAQLDNRGRVTSIRDKGGNTINRGPRGERRVESVRPDRSRVVSFGHRGGYVERPFDRGGRQYVSRTFVIGGHSYVHVYRGHYYHGVPYFVYVPPYYYAPVYYGWVYNPWPRPIYYTWGWYGSPWYRPYGYYFAPYPVYPYASLWLTDYLLAENLRLAYEADSIHGYQPTDSQAHSVLAAYHPGEQANGARPNSDPAVLSPEVKQMIADEVKAVIADEQKAASASSGPSRASSGDELPAALDPNHRVFVAFSVLELTANGETCSLTPSDVVKRTEDTPDNDNTVAVQILASKKSDCAMGSQARIQLTDLNDMQNHLREQVDAGMKMLADKQGKDGLPAAPAANPRAVPEGTAAPDATAAEDLQKQQQEADQTEKEVEQEAASDSGATN